MVYGVTMAGKPYKRPSEADLHQLLDKSSVSAVAEHLGVHRTSVRAWALKYGILDRQRPKEYTIPKGKELAELARRFTDAELARRFGCTEQTVRAHRHAIGFFRSRAKRRYSLDEDFFEKIDTEEKAYVLGFLAADGTVNVRSVWLMLHAKDEHIIRDIRKAMGSNARIFEREKVAGFPNRGPYKFIYFGSKKLVADLIKLGVTPRKSLTLQYTPVPQRLERHYLRGLFDGDGSIKKGSFTLLGTEPLVDGARSAILSHTGIELRKSHVENKLWILVGCRRSKKVLHWIYKDASIFLSRKYQMFLDHWQ